MQQQRETAVFGGGCFWCMEAVFQQIQGVLSVKSGYAGGTMKNPNYRAVCDGDTGHAEVVKIEFDTSVISYRELLEVFFSSHDPTTPNRQGNDVGEQYRSIILYTSESQKEMAEAYIQELTAGRVFPNKIVTQVQPLETFYEAEEYHQDYYHKNSNQPYCQVVISPKLAQVRQRHARLLNG
jgi:peptide-methionine (S)-S-oxide reductase